MIVIFTVLLFLTVALEFFPDPIVWVGIPEKYADSLSKFLTIVSGTLFLISLLWQVNRKLKNVEEALDDISEVQIEFGTHISDLFDKSSSDINGAISKALKTALKRVDQQIRIRPSDGYCDELFERIYQAKEIKNTFVGIDGIDPQQLSVIDLYESYFERNPSGKWTVIVGLSDICNERYSQLSEFKNDHVDMNLHIHILKGTPPLVNFILLKHADSNDDVVYFGWVAAPEAENWSQRMQSCVYYSEDADIVKFFDGYFDFLYKAYGWAGRPGPHVIKVNDQPLQTTGTPAFINKSGWWVTFLKNSSHSAPINFAFLRLDFSYSGEAKKDDIEVFLFNEDRSFKLAAAHGQALAHIGNELHFSWRQYDSDQKEEGYCTYSFKNEDDFVRLDGHVVSYTPKLNDVGWITGRKAKQSELEKLEKIYLEGQFRGKKTRDFTPKERKSLEKILQEISDI